MSGHDPRKRCRTDSSRQRAVSDVVAFVLTFSIIIAGVGIVSTGGFGQLTEFTNDQQVDNSDRGMQAAAATVDKLQQNGDTYREFDLALGGGNIWLNETTLTLESTGVNLSALGGDPDEAAIPLNALEHRFDRSDEVVNLAYEGGGAFRTGTANPGYRPSVTHNTDAPGNRTVISLVNLTTDESIDRSGSYASELTISPTGVPQSVPLTADSQFISFSAERVDQTQVYNGSANNITIDVSETAYPDQWEFYFEDRWTEEDKYVYSAESDAVLVRVVTVELSLLQREPL